MKKFLLFLAFALAAVGCSDKSPVVCYSIDVGVIAYSWQMGYVIRSLNSSGNMNRIAGFYSRDALMDYLEYKRPDILENICGADDHKQTENK